MRRKQGGGGLMSSNDHESSSSSLLVSSTDSLSTETAFGVASLNPSVASSPSMEHPIQSLNRTESSLVGQVDQQPEQEFSASGGGGIDKTFAGFLEKKQE